MRRAVVDANVLIYADDLRESDKMPVAYRLTRGLADCGALVVSNQVLSEYANAMLRKTRDPGFVEERVAVWMGVVGVVLVEPHVVLLALDGVERFGFPFYDAQIWAAARVSGISVVLSEDFADGLVADGVLFRDPFLPGFDLDEVLGD